jgi:hypothetical protein
VKLLLDAHVNGRLGEGRTPVACIVGIDHAEFGLILRVIEHALSTRSEHGSWIGFTAWGARSAMPHAPPFEGPTCIEAAAIPFGQSAGHYV